MIYLVTAALIPFGLTILVSILWLLFDKDEGVKAITVKRRARPGGEIDRRES